MFLAVSASKPFIDWNALGKIVLAALIGGAGVVIAFGIVLIALKRARLSDDNAPVRLGSWALAIVCGAFVIGAVVIGITAMVNKPSSSKPAPRKAAVTLTVPKQQQRLVA